MRKLKHCESRYYCEVWHPGQSLNSAPTPVLMLFCSYYDFKMCNMMYHLCHFSLILQHFSFCTMYFFLKSTILSTTYWSKMIHPSLRLPFPFAWCHDKKGKFKSYLMCHTLWQYDLHWISWNWSKFYRIYYISIASFRGALSYQINNTCVLFDGFF